MIFVFNLCERYYHQFRDSYLKPFNVGIIFFNVLLEWTYIVLRLFGVPRYYTNIEILYKYRDIIQISRLNITFIEKYIKTTNHSSTSNSCGIMSVSIETKPLQYHFRKLFSEQHVHYKLDWTVYSFHTHYKHIPLTSLDGNICFRNLSCHFIHSFGQYIHSALLKDKETRVSISHKLLIWTTAIGGLLLVHLSGAPNDAFLLNTMKTPFRLSRVFLDP